MEIIGTITGFPEGSPPPTGGIDIPDEPVYIPPPSPPLSPPPIMDYTGKDTSLID